jgi:hypothetical protein
MANKIAGQIKQIGGSIESLAGAEVGARVMEGTEMVATSNPEDVALWVKAAMNRLDTLADETTRRQIMLACGYNCILINKRPMETARARRQKYPDEEAFLTVEAHKPPRGMRFERQGNRLIQFYTPHTYGSGMHCYCSLMRGLPEGENVSPTYCQCSRGFVQKYWEGILGRPVQVELGETAISGADECKLVIHL